MIAVKIGWFVLEGTLIWSTVYYGSSLAVILAVFLAAVPLVSALINLYICRNVDVEIKADLNLRKGSGGRCVLHVCNPLRIPVFRIRYVVKAQNQLNREEKFMSLWSFLPPKKKQEEILTVKSDFCGRIRFSLEKAVFYDCFGLIGVPYKYSATAYMTVQPDTFEMETVLIPGNNNIDESDVYSQERPGADLTEIYQIREYVPGDSPRQVHWKLTNKFDRLIVRDPALPIMRNVLVFWERTGETDNRKLIDAQAEAMVSLCQSLLDQSIQFTIGWNDTDRNLCILYEIRTMDEWIGIIPRLMRAAGTKTGLSGAQLLVQTRPEALCGHMVYLACEPQTEVMEMKKYGNVTVLQCDGDRIEGALLFDEMHFREQLSFVQI
ncbi:MAG: DUF58 domain-containing protein [Lachnospiraceae bacterium]|nr:DUF58 domain-containing protein [Lachnospiraceae bacterium]